jgi:hypothetical protein
MRPDGAAGYEQLLPYLAIRQASRRQLGNLPFLRSERAPRRGTAFLAGLAGSLQLQASAGAPATDPEIVEQLTRGPQRLPGRHRSTPAAKQGTLSQQQPGPLERPPWLVSCQRRTEFCFRLAVRGEHQAGAPGRDRQS